MTPKRGGDSKTPLSHSQSLSLGLVTLAYKAIHPESSDYLDRAKSSAHCPQQAQQGGMTPGIS